MTKLMGKWALITGASRGLGKQISKTLWHAGANLILVARSLEPLVDLRNALLAEANPGQQVHILTADLADPDSVPMLVSQSRACHDHLDILINNAAIQGPIGKLWENDWNAWQETLRVNLLAPTELCRALIPRMLKQAPHCKIINLSGGGATSPRPHFSAYAVAKAGLVRLTETLAHELAGTSIDVNCVAPGVMHTDMLKSILHAGPDHAGAAEFAQASKHANAEHDASVRAAELCAYLASSESDGITGRLLSAVWDRWDVLHTRLSELRDSDVYTLRRIVPADRNLDWE